MASKPFTVELMTGLIKLLKFYKQEILTVETGDNSSVQKELMLKKQPLNWKLNKELYLDLQECKWYVQTCNKTKL
jgi:hypothetical protein